MKKKTATPTKEDIAAFAKAYLTAFHETYGDRFVLVDTDVLPFIDSDGSNALGSSWALQVVSPTTILAEKGDDQPDALSGHIDMICHFMPWFYKCTEDRRFIHDDDDDAVFSDADAGAPLAIPAPSSWCKSIFRNPFWCKNIPADFADDAIVSDTIIVDNTPEDSHTAFEHALLLELKTSGNEKLSSVKDVAVVMDIKLSTITQASA